MSQDSDKWTYTGPYYPNVNDSPIYNTVFGIPQIVDTAFRQALSVSVAKQLNGMPLDWKGTKDWKVALVLSTRYYLIDDRHDPAELAISGGVVLVPISLAGEVINKGTKAVFAMALEGATALVDFHMNGKEEQISYMDPAIFMDGKKALEETPSEVLNRYSLATALCPDVPYNLEAYDNPRFVAKSIHDLWGLLLGGRIEKPLRDLFHEDEHGSHSLPVHGSIINYASIIELSKGRAGFQFHHSAARGLWAQDVEYYKKGAVALTQKTNQTDFLPLTVGVSGRIKIAHYLVPSATAAEFFDGKNSVSHEQVRVLWKQGMGQELTNEDKRLAVDMFLFSEKHENQEWSFACQYQHMDEDYIRITNWFTEQPPDLFDETTRLDIETLLPGVAVAWGESENRTPIEQLEKLFGSDYRGTGVNTQDVDEIAKSAALYGLDESVSPDRLFDLLVGNWVGRILYPTAMRKQLVITTLMNEDVVEKVLNGLPDDPRLIETIFENRGAWCSFQTSHASGITYVINEIWKRCKAPPMDAPEFMDKWKLWCEGYNSDEVSEMSKMNYSKWMRNSLTGLSHPQRTYNQARQEPNLKM